MTRRINCAAPSMYWATVTRCAESPGCIIAGVVDFVLFLEASP
jgi:hypothetical protein